MRKFIILLTLPIALAFVSVEAKATCYTECVIGLEPICGDAYNECIDSGTPPATCALDYSACERSNQSYCEWYCSNQPNRDSVMKKLKIIPGGFPPVKLKK